LLITLGVRLLLELLTLLFKVFVNTTQDQGSVYTFVANWLSNGLRILGLSLKVAALR